MDDQMTGQMCKEIRYSKTTCIHFSFLGANWKYKQTSLEGRRRKQMQAVDKAT